MAAPKGNQFWKARSSHGRGKIFETQEQLWDASCEYFQWVEDNPLYEAKAFSFKGESWIESLPKMRAMTIQGLCFFLGIDQDTLLAYGNREDFIGVVREIKGVIYDQKFAGASADLLNANIIARDLGLIDKKDLSSSDGSLSPNGNTFDSEMYRKAQEKLREKIK